MAKLHSRLLSVKRKRKGDKLKEQTTQCLGTSFPVLRPLLILHAVVES